MGPTMNPSADDLAEWLLRATGTFRDHWIPVDGDRPSGFVSPKTVDIDEIDLILTTNYDEAIREVMARWVAQDPPASAVDVESSDYPERLRDLDGRPALLFIHGCIPESDRSPVAIVGSRKATAAGRKAATEIARQLGESGSVVVSGLAEGIDTAAHEGVLKAGGKTVAVMGTGLGRVFPAANEGLARRISRSGALVTQFPPDYGPTKTTFPARNALIAGLSDVSLLVEMSESSGTRIEANCAIAQGKQVLLWEPLLGDKAWAQEFAEQPLVRFVSSSTEVVELAG